MHFELSKALKAERHGFTAFKYWAKTDNSVLNAIYVDCKTGHARVFVKNSHRLYFVINGKGKFSVGSKEFPVKPGDVVLIPPKTEYAYKGKMKLFEVNTPSTSSEDEVKV